MSCLTFTELMIFYHCVCVFVYVGENKKEREIGGERKSADCGRLLSISPTCGCPGVRVGLT